MSQKPFAGILPKTRAFCHFLLERKARRQTIGKNEACYGSIVFLRLPPGRPIHICPGLDADQRAGQLDSDDWTTLTNVPVLNLTNLQDQLTLAPDNNRGFFRLISQ
jgi:hypothetical protein